MSYLKDPLHEPHLSRGGEPLDAAMQEVVQTFETLYAGLAPPPEAPGGAHTADDWAIELPDDLPAASSVNATAQPATFAQAHNAERAAPPAHDVASRPRLAPARVSLPDTAPADTRDWSAGSRTAWPRLLLAAGITLALGTGIGYMAGKTPGSGVSATKTAPSPEGGARLRFDYDLKNR